VQQIAIACCIDERSERPGDARAPLAVPASEEALLVSVNSTRFLHDEEEGHPSTTSRINGVHITLLLPAGQPQAAAGNMHATSYCWTVPYPAVEMKPNWVGSDGPSDRPS